MPRASFGSDLRQVREKTTRGFLVVVFGVSLVASGSLLLREGVHLGSLTHPIVSGACLAYGFATRRFRVPTIVFMIYTLALLPYFASIFGTGVYAPATRWLPLFPLVCAFLIGGRATIVFSVLAIGCFAFIALTQPTALGTAANLRQTQIVVPLATVISGVVAYLFENRVVTILAALREEVTERKRLADELRSQNLEIVARNEDLEMFNRLASHDLRAPVHVIQSFAELLQDDCGKKLTATENEQLASIESAAMRLGALLESLSNYARSGGLRTLATIDVRAVLADVATSLSGLIAEADAEIVVGELPATIVADPMTSQVFQNLIQNAIKFRRPGVPPRIEISGGEDADGWRFSIVDNGIGIAEEHRARVFEPFQRLRAKDFAGTGLGLALVRRIIEGQGGDVKILPNVEEGTTFVVRLPKRSPPA